MNLLKKLKNLNITPQKLAIAEHPEIKKKYKKNSNNFVTKLDTSYQFWRRKFTGTPWSTADI